METLRASQRLNHKTGSFDEIYGATASRSVTISLSKTKPFSL